MSVGVCIEYEDYVAHRSQWDYALMNFTTEYLYVHGVGGKDDLRGRVVAGAIYVDSVKDLPDDHALVLLAPRDGREVKGDEPLSTFEHPGKAVYYFGSNSEHVLPEHLEARKPDHLVYIDLASHRDMWSWMAWALVAYDRSFKEMKYGKCGEINPGHA